MIDPQKETSQFIANEVGMKLSFSLNPERGTDFHE